MFVVNDLPAQLAPDLAALLARAEPATIGHFLHAGYVDPAISARWQVPRIAGTAVTVRCTANDSTIVHYALGKLRPGDILLIDRAGDTRLAPVGGGVAFAAREAGCLGIIVDGVTTDIQEVRDYKVPVWSRGLTAITTKVIYQQGEFCVPISIGGVPVLPGDAILADENGILVLPPDPARITAAAERAIAMQQAEGPRLAEVAKGHRLPDLNGVNAKLQAILDQQRAG